MKLTFALASAALLPLLCNAQSSAAGAACSYSSDCADQLYCVVATAGASKTCATQTLGQYCEEQDACKWETTAAGTRLFCDTATNQCTTPGAIGASCTGLINVRNLMAGYESVDCAAGAYCVASTCTATQGDGSSCSQSYECNGWCNTNTNQCASYLVNGATCTNDNECGGTTPPYSWGACNTDNECYDVGDAIGGAVAGALGIMTVVFIGGPLLGICCCAAIIWMACCRKSTTVVVQQS